MSVAVCQLSTMTRLGGVEQLVSDLMLRPAQRNIRYHLVAPSATPALLLPLQQAQLSLLQPRRAGRFDPRAFVAVARWLQRHNVAVVHSYNAYANIWGAITARIGGIASHVTGEHGSIWWVKPPLRWLDRLAQRRARLIIANSHASKRLLQLRYGVAADRIAVVHNGVPPLPAADRQAQRAGWGWQDKVVIASIGRLDTPKNFDLLIDVAAAVLRLHDDVRFLLIGGGPLQARLQGRIDAAAIGDRFKMTGARSDARSLIQSCDIVVSTSLRETFGLTLVEAALAALPVVAPAVDGITEVVDDGQSGFLLTASEAVLTRTVPAGATPLARRVLIDGRLQPPHSAPVDAYVNALQPLIRSADLRRAIGAQARQHATTHFSFSRFQQRLEQLYCELAGGC